MKNYDYAKVKTFIDQHANIISEVSLGMQEDWFWTGQTVYENGEFVIDLTENDLKIGGINGSSWATPTMDVTYFDGASERIEISKGNHSIDDITERIEQEMFLTSNLGCLSGPVQEKISPITRKI